MLTIVNTMPTRVPIFVKSVVRLDRVEGNSVWTALEQIPYTITKATNPPKVEIPIQQRRRMPAHDTNGMSVLNGPKYLSARKAGISRPGMPTPFKIIKSVSEVDDDTWITFFPKVVTCSVHSPMSALSVPVLTFSVRERAGRT